ncbi:hypothetical protein [Streptomyces sp. NPDC050485]|uniref:hypothetical protein n=1 Tax=Streptomyces sp. NPDC050485 TaxID=3365617 RepID=UPI003795D436
MSGVWVRRAAMPHARRRSARLLVAALVVLATLVLACPRPTGGTSPVSRVSAAAMAMPMDASGAAMAQHGNERPCKQCVQDTDGQGGDHCHAPDHHGVLGHTPAPGQDHAVTAGRPRTSPVRSPLRPSRVPGGARPPDLHQLQLLRV